MCVLARLEMDMEAGSKDDRVGEESESETQDWRSEWLNDGYRLRGVGVASGEGVEGEVKRDRTRLWRQAEEIGRG